MIELFKQNGLLDQFKIECWPRGIGNDGDAECRRCLREKANFEKKWGSARFTFLSQKSPTNRIEAAPKAEAHATKSDTESRLVEDSPANRITNTTLIEDIDEVKHRDIGATTKSALVNARIGQGQFRTDVFSRWGNRCAVTGSTTREAIRASHILPWRDSTDEQRLDPNNGLPLIANLDALFDIGLISFDSSGQLLVSSKLAEAERRIFGLGNQALLKSPSEKTAAYLAGHRQKHGFGE
ncbi:MAG: HNH endonuclease [Planctomycetaceae bacterium]